MRELTWILGCSNMLILSGMKEEGLALCREKRDEEVNLYVASNPRQPSSRTLDGPPYRIS